LEQVKAAKPELAAPLAAYLLHPSCPYTGQGYFCGAGTVSGMSMGSSKGATDPNLTIERVAEFLASGAGENDVKMHATTAEQMSYN
jgi:hypothetical protein